jgi:hypothetical protein
LSVFLAGPRPHPHLVTIVAQSSIRRENREFETHWQISGDVREILALVGRLVHYILIPWNDLLAVLFSFVPISIPQEWRSLCLPESQSAHHPWILTRDPNAVRVVNSLCRSAGTAAVLAHVDTR